MSEAIFHDSESDLAYKARWWTSRVVIYGILILWTIVCLFPIYWTITTSFKAAPNVMQGQLIPFVDFEPQWLGWKSLGLSPDTIGSASTVRDQFFARFGNSAIVSLAASGLAVFLGTITGYGLSRFGYQFGRMRNADISFFFISQLILPPVVLALPFLVLYKELALLDTHIGLIMLYALTVLPIVVWIMRDQFMTIPAELDEAAMATAIAKGRGSRWACSAVAMARWPSGRPPLCCCRCLPTATPACSSATSTPILPAGGGRTSAGKPCPEASKAPNRLTRRPAARARRLPRCLLPAFSRVVSPAVRSWGSRTAR